VGELFCIICTICIFSAANAAALQEAPASEQGAKEDHVNQNGGRPSDHEHEESDTEILILMTAIEEDSSDNRHFFRQLRKYYGWT